jgi:cytochrome bd-type quinol oxidase subunit 2
MIPLGPITLTHMQAFLLFAAVISIAFGFLGRRQPKDRVRYILWTFVMFLLIGIGIGWAMYPFSR